MWRRKVAGIRATRPSSSCSKAGGGRVVIPSGNWFCAGPIVLLSNVHVHLMAGARIYFSNQPADYARRCYVGRLRFPLELQTSFQSLSDKEYGNDNVPSSPTIQGYDSQLGSVHELRFGRQAMASQLR